MTKVKDIFNFINEFAPFENALSFDNCGLLIGKAEQEIKNAVLSLDITKDVVKEAKNLNANLIISHHPVIFKPISAINRDSAIYMLCKNDISAICAHTNLDIASEGVNFQLAKKLNLQNLATLTYEEEKPLGLIGNLNREFECKEFAEYVKESLGCNGVRYTAIKNKKIKTAAVCSGSGGEFYKEAFEKGADVIIIGEIKHSQIIAANELGIMVVDAGHYKTENVILEPLKNMLAEKFTNINFYLSKVFTDNVNYI